MVIILFNKILSMALMVLVGVLLVKCRLLTIEDSHVFSVICLYVIMPCVLLTAFQVDFTPDVRDGLLLALGAAVLIHVVLIALNLPLRKLLHLDAVEQLSILYSNAGNLIIPIVTALLGKEWVIYSCAFLSVQQLLLWSHGKATICGQHGLDLRAIFTNVNIICIFAGIVLLLTGLRLPAIVTDTMDSIGGMVGPVAMFITGMLLARHSLKDFLVNPRLWLTAALRLLAVPLLVLALFKASGIAYLISNGNQVLLVTFLAVITPSASTITQFAQIYGHDADYAGEINVLTTLLCVASMPAMVALYQMVM